MNPGNSRPDTDAEWAARIEAYRLEAELEEAGEALAALKEARGDA